LQVRGHPRATQSDRTDAMLTASNEVSNASVRRPNDQSSAALPKFDGGNCAVRDENSLPSSAAPRQKRRPQDAGS
jgi:hypothetical protein